MPYPNQASPDVAAARGRVRALVNDLLPEGVDEGTGAALDPLIASWASGWLARIDSEHADHHAVIDRLIGGARQQLADAEATHERDRRALEIARRDYADARERLMEPEAVPESLPGSGSGPSRSGPRPVPDPATGPAADGAACCAAARAGTAGLDGTRSPRNPPRCTPTPPRGRSGSGPATYGTTLPAGAAARTRRPPRRADASPSGRGTRDDRRALPPRPGAGAVPAASPRPHPSRARTGTRRC